jgi:feruloyl-CoA ortho-hydroxylase
MTKKFSLFFIGGKKDSAHTFFNMPTEKKVAYRQNSKMKYGTSFVPEKENVLEWKDYIIMEYSSDEDALKYWPNVCK